MNRLLPLFICKFVLIPVIISATDLTKVSFADRSVQLNDDILAAGMGMRTMLADSFQECASLLPCHCREDVEDLPISRHSAERSLCAESRPQVARHMKSNDGEEFDHSFPHYDRWWNRTSRGRVPGLSNCWVIIKFGIHCWKVFCYLRSPDLCINPLFTYNVRFSKTLRFTYKSPTLAFPKFNMYGDALNMARTIPELASANHLMCAYRFGDGDKWNQNFDSDGDCGVGLHMLEYMIDNTIDSTILIVARHCTADC